MWDFALGQPEFSCTDTLIMGGRVNDLAFAGGNRLVTAVRMLSLKIRTLR